MAIIWIIVIAILGILGAAVSRQVSDEFRAWMPWIIQHVIDLAVRTLPENHRERFAEEWRSHADEIPGDIGKMIVALGFLVASSRMAGLPTAAGKRIVDVTISSAVLLLLAPLLLLTGIFIKIDSPGSVIFRQARIGQYGKRFYIFKFRTTSANEHFESHGATRVGHVLRLLSLDELPLLFNVLVGDMSFVGPRPRSINDDGPSVLGQSVLKPGIVLDDYLPASNSSPGKEDRYNRELNYLQNHSFILDLKIICRVFWRLFSDGKNS